MGNSGIYPLLNQKESLMVLVATPPGSALCPEVMSQLVEYTRPNDDSICFIVPNIVQYIHNTEE